MKRESGRFAKEVESVAIELGSRSVEIVEIDPTKRSATSATSERNASVRREIGEVEGEKRR